MATRLHRTLVVLVILISAQFCLMQAQVALGAAAIICSYTGA
jgi:hypothetical protein